MERTTQCTKSLGMLLYWSEQAEMSLCWQIPMPPVRCSAAEKILPSLPPIVRPKPLHSTAGSDMISSEQLEAFGPSVNTVSFLQKLSDQDY